MHECEKYNNFADSRAHWFIKWLWHKSPITWSILKIIEWRWNHHYLHCADCARMREEYDAWVEPMFRAEDT